MDNANADSVAEVRSINRKNPMPMYSTMRCLCTNWLMLALSLTAHAATPTNPIANTITVAGTTPAPPRVMRTVNFSIDMRAEIAAGRFNAIHDRVGVRGATPPLSWADTLQAMPSGEGHYQLRVTFNRPAYGGQPLQYKFKIDRPGIGPNEGWEEGRNRIMPLNDTTQYVSRTFNSSPEAVPLERAGRIDRIAPIPSKHVPPREVQVWLPPGYEKELTRRYPVLYLHDGQVMFDAEASGAEWQVDETAQRLVLAGAIEPLVIVAVANSAARMEEYTPTSTLLSAARTGLPDDRRMGGGIARYAEYLTTELKPEIDRRYRTRPEAAHTAVGGSSLGGLASMWLALHRADVFGAALVVSPSVWWDDKFILRDVADKPFAGKCRSRIRLDIGTLEGYSALPEARQLHEALLRRGWDRESLSYLEQADGTHDEASWALRVEGMLRFLHGRK